MKPKGWITPPITPEALKLIEELLVNSGVRSAFYAGYAQDSLMRLLAAKFGGDLAVMDYWDDFGSGAACFRDDEDEYPVKDRPEWLKGVTFVQEGIPRGTDWFIWELSREHICILSALKFSPEACPRVLLLLNDACRDATHPDYDWDTGPGYALGVLDRPRTGHRPRGDRLDES